MVGNVEGENGTRKFHFEGTFNFCCMTDCDYYTIDFTEEDFRKWMRGIETIGGKEPDIEEVQLIDSIIYHSLVELPNGEHVPLPIAIGPHHDYHIDVPENIVKKVRDTIINKVSLAKKVRDENFFESGYYKEYEINNDTIEHFKEKEKMLIDLVMRGEYNKLKIVVAKPPACYDEENEEEFE